MKTKWNCVKNKYAAVLVSSSLIFAGVQSNAYAEFKTIDPDCVSLIVDLNWAIESARSAVFAAGQALADGDLDGAIDAYDDYTDARIDEWQISREIEDKGCL
jgi:hypothetical protein